MFGFGMLDGMFGDMMDPFGMMGGNRQRRNQQLVQHQSPFGPMMPFGFPDIGGMMRQMEQAMHDPNAMTMNGPGFMSSSVVQMTYDGTGQPQIYQESATTRQAPGGARETRRTVTDTVTGTKKMSIGHHMGARARVVERKQDLNTREMEENEELINLSDDEKDEFEREWQQRANVGQPRAMAAREAIGHHGHRPGHRSEMLALPAPGHASRSSHPRSERRSRGPHGSTTHGRPRRDQRRLPHH